MSNKRGTGRIYKREIMEQVARMTDFRFSDVEECLKAYYVCVRKNLLDGKIVKLDGIGEFSFVQVKGQPFRENVILNPSYPDIRGDKPATKGFYRLGFKANPTFREELKELTYGKTEADKQEG